MPGFHSLGLWLAGAGLAGALAASDARAASPAPNEFRLQPVADTSIYADPLGSGSEWDSVSDGQGESLWLSTTAGGIVRRALLRFDLGVIPSDQRVVSVSLTLFESRAQGVHNVSLHRLLAPWGEGASNGGSAGVGDAAKPGDATWLWRDLGVAAWQQRGGDFEAQASASLLVGEHNSFYTWASTPTLVADVQGWLDQPGSSFGWILIGDESGSKTGKRFDSLQSLASSQRPMLLVQTVPVPEPASLWLLAAGGLGLAWRLRSGRGEAGVRGRR